MQRLEFSGAVRLIYKSLGVKGLSALIAWCINYKNMHGPQNSTSDIAVIVIWECFNDVKDLN